MGGAGSPALQTGSVSSLLGILAWSMRLRLPQSGLTSAHPLQPEGIAVPFSLSELVPVRGLMAITDDA